MPSLDPPVPTSAEWNFIFERLDIDFSHTILDVPALNLGNWFLRVGNAERDVEEAAVVLGRVRLIAPEGDANPGPDVVTYTPPPFDVISDTAKPTPAPAFADFPVV